MSDDIPFGPEIQRIKAGRSRRIAGLRIMVINKRSSIWHAYDPATMIPVCVGHPVDWEETFPMWHNFLNDKRACKTCVKRLIGPTRRRARFARIAPTGNK